MFLTYLHNVIFTASVFMLSFVFLGCSENKDALVVRQNIQAYIEEKNDKNVAVITEYKHSKLYMLSPLDETKIPNPEIPDDEDEKLVEAINYGFNGDRGIKLSLIGSGCGNRTIDNIIENDMNLRKWGTGAKEYIMITFVTLQSVDGKLSQELGLCFRLSQELNIQDIYSVNEDDEDYVFIRLFGQTNGRFYGAVECKYNYLVKMYELYTKDLKEDKLSTNFRYKYIKDLNDLFGTERFEYNENKEAAIETCIEKLDYYEDVRALKDRAVAIIKGL